MRVGRVTRVLLVFTLMTLGCTKSMHREVVPPDQVETLDNKAAYLKVHTQRGEVYVLHHWSHNATENVVGGVGRQLDANRRELAEGPFVIPLDSVVLFETNVTHTSSAVAVLAVLTGISAGVTVYCASNPKACFGSCPTFYVSDGERDILQAEGFSASIAPSLEATDVDHLYRTGLDSRRLDVRMTNEALETHIVRYVNLLAVDRGTNERVFADTHGKFWQAGSVITATECRGKEGDCLDAIVEFDGKERTSLADSTDLAARETVHLTFPATDGDQLAVVLASRQSLLPTFLLYQALAWLGTSVGHWLATLERGDQNTADRVSSVVQTLGGIEVMVQDSTGAWQPVAEVIETGPLGTDVRLVRIPPQRDSIRVQLRMAQGAWRLDYVALARLVREATPVRIHPQAVLVAGTPQRGAVQALLDSSHVLTTFPGDEYVLRYELPVDYSRYEIFLESRGYYLEWMREEWMAEENQLKAAGLFLDPARTLRELAPKFKRVEPHMETAFWNSKYVRP